MTANEESPPPAPSQADIARARLKTTRWVQLIIGIVCMVMIANLQYGWTLFVTPMTTAHHWSLAAIQGTFTMFVAVETWLVPVEGYLVDRFGPRAVTIAGGVLVAAGWTLNSMADSLPFLYVGQAIGGIGAGAVYGTCVGNALKWFPEKRGLASGLTAAGFGAGSALTVAPISNMIESSGYAATFLYFGLGQGLIVIVLGLLLAQPDANAVAALPRPPPIVAARPQLQWKQMLQTKVFWVMYLMFFLMAVGGLFFTANLKQVAEGFKIDKVPVSLIFTSPAARFALELGRVLNGITRPIFGWISDRIGRENTMFIAFFVEAVGIVLFSQFGDSPVPFVLLSGLVFFASGEIYSLFPATCTDTYGWKYAASNSGVLYTAKGTASLLIAPLTKMAGSSGWNAVFWIIAIMNFTAAILAIVVLKPMRRRLMAQPAKVQPQAEMPPPAKASA